MAPHRRRAVPTSDSTLVQRVRKSFATDPEAIALIDEAEKAVATAGDTLSAGGKLAPAQGEVASAIHGSNVPAKPKKTGPAKLEDENGEAIRGTAQPSSPVTAPVAFSETPAPAPSVSRAVARKKVDPDSTEGKALELYVEQLVSKLAITDSKSEGILVTAVPSIDEVFEQFCTKYDDSQPRGDNGKWVGEGGGGGAEGSISAHKPTPVAGGPKYAMSLGTANALGTALAAYGYNKAQVISHLGQQGFAGHGKTAERVLAAHSHQLDIGKNVVKELDVPPPPEDPPESEQLPRDSDEPEITKADVRKSMFCEFVNVQKAEEKQIMIGIVLAPEEVDAQLDIYDAEVIEQAAHKFLANYNAGTKMGHLHKEFNRPLELVESYIAPTDFKLNKRAITKGTWMMAVKVKDPTLWEKVKNGELTGFSIGGVAKVQKLGNE